MLDYFRTLAILTALTAVACAPPRQPPVKPVALDHGRDVEQAELAQGWPEPDWWVVYGDAQLDHLVARAIQHSPRLAAAAARIREAEAMAHQAKGAQMPSLGASADFNRTLISDAQVFNGTPIGGAWLWSNEASLGLSYELDLWGRRRNTTAGALASEQVAAYDAKAARLVLEGAVVRTYAELTLQLELADIARATQADEVRTRGIAEARQKAGLGTELPLRHSDAQIESTRADLERIQGRLGLLRHQLAVLLGDGPAGTDNLCRPTLQLAQGGALPTRVPAELIGRRPDVVAARWMVERAARGIEVAREAFYPNVDLVAMGGFLSFGFTNFLGRNANEAGVGPAISLPIFQGGRLRAGVEARNAEYDAAVAGYNETVVQGLGNVADQITALKALQNEAAAWQAALKTAGRAHQLAMDAFRAGLGEYLDVLATEITLNAQRERAAQVKYAQIERHAALQQALGGGLVVDGAVKAETLAVPHREGRQP